MSDQETGAPQEPLSVYAFLAVVVDQLASVGWQKLGLQPDIVTGKIAADLTEAKLAIDLTAHIASLMEHQLDDDDKRRLQNLVRDLRINFVEKSKEAGI